METKTFFAKRLLDLRERRDITQQQLADEIGVTRQSLSLYEAGERTINIELLERICKYFQVSADYLIGLSDASSLDIEMQNMSRALGLDEEAIEAIITTGNEPFSGYLPPLKSALSIVLSQPHFWEILRSMCSLRIQSELSKSCSDELDQLPKPTIEDVNTDVFYKYEKVSYQLSIYEIECDTLRYRTMKALEKLCDIFDARENN